MDKDEYEGKNAYLNDFCLNMLRYKWTFMLDFRLSDVMLFFGLPFQLFSSKIY